MGSLQELINRLGSGRLIMLGVLVIGFLTLGWVISSRLTTQELALLYADLDVGDAGRIANKLEEREINFKVSGGGTQIYVPVDMVARLRMDMAEAGLPNGGSVGYEIFDRSEMFGSSFFVQNLNHVRALEGELARTIRTLAQVASARVHLVLPRRELFSKETQEPSASIALRLQSAGRLDRDRVQAIQNLVAAAVPGLKINRIAVIDDRGNLLSEGGDQANSAISRKSEEFRLDLQHRVERSITSLLERTLGVGKVRAEVFADIDFDKVVENQEIYDPDGQVARSTQTINENNNTQELATNAAATVANEIPGAGGAQGGGTNNSDQKRTEEVINYEINKTVRHYEREVGAIKRLSIAVLVDGETKENTYTPRSKEDLQQVEKLVKSAIGFKADRGDTLEVINMQFAPEEAMDLPDISNGWFGLDGGQIIRLLEIFTLFILGFLAIWFIMRPIALELFKPSKQESVKQETDKPVEPAPEAVSAPDPEPSEVEKMIDLKQVEGKVRQSAINKISEIIEAHPDETASVIRNWMNDKES